MFYGAIDELKPWTEQGYFENVSAPMFREGRSDYDATMVALARALYSRRMGDDSFKIFLSNAHDDERLISDASEEIDYIVARATNGTDDVHTISNTVIISQFFNAAGFDQIKEPVNKYFSGLGWKHNEKAEFFLNKEMKAIVVLNEEKNAAIVFIDTMTMPHWHLLCSVLPSFTPGLFVTESLQADEMAVLKTLTTRRRDDFISAMTKLENRYDIRGKKIRSIVSGFEQTARKRQIDAVDRALENNTNEIDSIMSRYRELVEKRDELSVRRNGLKYLTNDAGDEALVNFFEATKCLDVVETYGSMITFIVRTYYANYDVDLYERYRENSDFIGESEVSGVFSDPENRKKIMDAMFITEKLKLKMCAVYHLDIVGNVSTTAGYRFPANCADYIPNYHLNHHSCFGNYFRVITDYLSKGDTIGAIGACIASAQSVNIGESGPTFNPMMKDVFSSRRNIFELPDGTSVTPVKALEWLNSQEG